MIRPSGSAAPSVTSDMATSATGFADTGSRVLRPAMAAATAGAGTS